MHLASERSFSVVNSCHSSLSSYIMHVQIIANKKKPKKKKERRLGWGVKTVVCFYEKRYLHDLAKFIAHHCALFFLLTLSFTWLFFYMVIICEWSDCGSSDHIPFSLLNGCNVLVYGEEALDLWLEVTHLLYRACFTTCCMPVVAGLHRQVLDKIDTGAFHW